MNIKKILFYFIFGIGFLFFGIIVLIIVFLLEINRIPGYIFSPLKKRNPRGRLL